MSLFFCSRNKASKGGLFQDSDFAQLSLKSLHLLLICIQFTLISGDYSFELRHSQRCQLGNLFKLLGFHVGKGSASVM